jgi:DNA-binding MurR/RpiR family transcriptional regulator
MSRTVTQAAQRVSAAGTPPSLLKLRTVLPSLPEYHARIAHFAMTNPAEFLELDAREIGYRCGTSEATVVRFCQRIGYRGLSEIKNVLARELAANLVASRPARRFAGNNSVPERVFSSCEEALDDTLSGLDRAKIEAVAVALARSERLYLFGAGGSAHIAQVAALNFLALGFQTVAFVDLIQQHAAAKLATPQDIAIAVTHSGNQPEVAEALTAAKKRHAFCVAITSFQQSLIVKSADELLLMFIPPETLRGQAGAHRVTQIALLDTLAVRAAEIRPAVATRKSRVNVKRAIRKVP